MASSLSLACNVAGFRRSEQLYANNRPTGGFRARPAAWEMGFWGDRLAEQYALIRDFCVTLFQRQALRCGFRNDDISAAANGRVA
jgi:hypothetical protein